MPTVLHVFKRAFPDSVGGVERVIHNLCLGLSERGYQCVVLALSENFEKTIYFNNNYKVVFVKQYFELFSVPFSLKYISAFRNLSKSCDIIHYHFPFPLMDICSFFVSSKFHVSCLTYHSEILRYKHIKVMYKILQELFFGRIDCFVFSTKTYFDHISRKFDSGRKSFVVPFGLDFASPEYSQVDQPICIRNLPPMYACFVGYFRTYKGLFTLCDASKYSGVPIVLVGTGPLEVSLKRYCLERDIQNIYIVGHLTDAQRNWVLQNASAFVLPSNSKAEAFGISLLEAAYFGLPLITCNTGSGHSEINIDGVTGLVVPADNYVLLGDALKKLYNHKSAQRKYGKSARSHVLENFSLVKMVNSYDKIYKKFLKIKYNQL